MIRKLCELHGIAGMEAQVRQFIKSEIQDSCDVVYEDKKGNLHAVKKRDMTGILLTVYMDEPGIIITDITEDGYLKFETVGRMIPSSLVSKRVWIQDTLGIISLKAIHLASKEERETPIKASQLFVDIGAKNKTQAETMIMIGDYGLLDSVYREMQNGYIKGRALAGRMGCNAAIELLKKTEMPLHVVFAVQREIQCRGIQAALLSEQNQYQAAFIIEAAEEAVSEREGCKSGKGPCVFLRTKTGLPNGSLLRIAKETAQEKGISLQYIVSEEKGQEWFVAANKSQTPWICLGIPVRYKTTASQVANISDLEKLIYFMQEMIKKLQEEERHGA